MTVMTGTGTGPPRDASDDEIPWTAYQGTRAITSSDSSRNVSPKVSAWTTMRNGSVSRLLKMVKASGPSQNHPGKMTSAGEALSETFKYSTIRPAVLLTDPRSITYVANAINATKPHPRAKATSPDDESRIASRAIAKANEAAPNVAARIAATRVLSTTTLPTATTN